MKAVHSLIPDEIGRGAQRPRIPILLAALAALLTSCGERASEPCGPAPASLVQLSGAVAVSPTDIWAVGVYQDRSPAEPLTEHWDGRRWKAVPAPVGSWTVTAHLNAVSAAGSHDLWAVGGGQSVGTEERTLIEHWDGSTWTIIASPNAGERWNHLAALVVLAADDAWAVGSYQQSSSLLTLTEHWNGKVWSVVPGVNPAAGINGLSAVSGTSSSDVWAVGYRRESDAAMPQTLIEHWDGHRWNLVAGAPAGGASGLSAVAALSPDHVWAAGTSRAGDSNTPLIERWNGKEWAIVPGAPVSNVRIGAIGAISSTDAWIAGEAGQGEGVHSLFVHWDGTRWRIVPPATGQTDDVNSLTALGPSDVWAVGSYRKNSCGPDWALIQRWDGNAWHRVSSPHDG